MFSKAEAANRTERDVRIFGGFSGGVSLLSVPAIVLKRTVSKQVVDKC